MEVVAEKGLIHEKVLIADCKDLFHANLRDTINKELFIMTIIVLKVVLFAANLIQVDTTYRYAHCTSSNTLSFVCGSLIEQYLDELTVRTRKLMRAIHAHLLFDLELIIYSIVDCLLWIYHINPVQLALMGAYATLN